MDLGLKGKIAIVTGGTEGIGKASAIEFAREGAKVAICARNAENIRKTVDAIKSAGGEVFGMVADMSKAEDIENFIAAVVKQYGGIDILVNNAGTSARGAFLDIKDETWRSDIELKVFGAIRCTRLAIPHMQKRGGGRVINITSVNAKQPAGGSMPTSISRAAGLAMTKALSKEFAADNILVNTVCIGKIKSGQHERRYTKAGISADEYYAKDSKTIPLGRFGEAAEAANVIVFLCSAAASYVTGTSVNLDGGMSGVL